MKIDIQLRDLDPADAAACMARLTTAMPPFAAPPGTHPPAPVQVQQPQPVGLPVAAAAAPAVPGPGVATAAAPVPQGLTLDMVKQQMNVFVGQHGAAQGKGVLTTNGVDQLRNAPPEKWAALYVGFGGTLA